MKGEIRPVNPKIGESNQNMVKLRRFSRNFELYCQKIQCPRIGAGLGVFRSGVP